MFELEVRIIMQTNKIDQKSNTTAIETDIVTHTAVEKFNLSFFKENPDLLSRNNIIDLLTYNGITVLLVDQPKRLEIYHKNQKIDVNLKKNEQLICPYTVYFHNNEYYLLFSSTKGLHIGTAISGKYISINADVSSLLKKAQLLHFWHDNSFFYIIDKNIFMLDLTLLNDNEEKILPYKVYSDEHNITDVEKYDEKVLMILKKNIFKSFSLNEHIASKISKFDSLENIPCRFIFNISSMFCNECENYLLITNKGCFIVYDTLKKKIILEKHLESLNMHNLSQKPFITMSPNDKIIFFTDYLQRRVILLIFDENLSNINTYVVEKWHKKEMIDPMVVSSSDGSVSFIAYNAKIRQFVYRSYSDLSNKSLAEVRTECHEESIMDEQTRKVTPKCTKNTEYETHKCNSLFLCDCKSKPAWTDEYLKSIKEMILSDLEEKVKEETKKQSNAMLIELKSQFDNMSENKDKLAKNLVKIFEDTKEELNKLQKGFILDPVTLTTIQEIKEKFITLEKQLSPD